MDLAQSGNILKILADITSVCSIWYTLLSYTSLKHLEISKVLFVKLFKYKNIV